MTEECRERERERERRRWKREEEEDGWSADRKRVEERNEGGVKERSDYRREDDEGPEEEEGEHSSLSLALSQLLHPPLPPPL